MGKMISLYYNHKNKRNKKTHKFFNKAPSEDYLEKTPVK